MVTALWRVMNEPLLVPKFNLYLSTNFLLAVMCLF